MLKSWRDASTLIVIAKQEALSRLEKPKGVNYDILLQTRGRRATFANSLVFPGGVAEAADSSGEWVRLIKSFGFSQCHFDALHCPGAPVTPIFQQDPILRHVSLRITAIRETFEELGLLICSGAKSGERPSLWATFSSNFDVKHWQQKVSKDPSELFNLCKQLNVYPDIWSLHYWSNWLTPEVFEKRFDTAFFVTALANKPKELESNNEVVNVEWSSPTDVLEKNLKKEVKLFVPQAYEFHRLSELPDIDSLIRFAKERSCKGNELLYPVIVQAKDGRLHVLPGDDLYPKELGNYNGNIVKTHKGKTVDELRASGTVLHRFEHSDTRNEIIIRNFKPPYHITMGDRVIKVYDN